MPSLYQGLALRKGLCWHLSLQADLAGFQEQALASPTRRWQELLDAGGFLCASLLHSGSWIWGTREADRGRCTVPTENAILSLYDSVVGRNPSKMNRKIISFHCQIMQMFMFSLMNI